MNTAVVVDEYGTIQGIVMSTDLLEAVAGDLPDVDVGSRGRMLDAAMPMSKITDLYGFRKLPVGEFVTLAGFVL